MSDLVEFLRARLDEDEQIARAAIQGPWRMGSDQGPMHWLGSGGAKRPPEDILFGQSPIRADAWVQVADLSAAWSKTENGHHIARWDPARVLAEVEAKRRIVALCTAVVDSEPYAEEHDLAFATLDALAQPYVDHPDFDPAWRVENHPDGATQTTPDQG